MNLTQYQIEAAKTKGYLHQDRIGGLYYAAMGLAGEAGEFTGAVSKLMRDDKLEANDYVEDMSVDQQIHLVEELGDVLWFLSCAADELDVSLSEVAEINIEKLRGRAERGTIGGSGEGR